MELQMDSIGQFFRNYERDSNRGDIQSLVSNFANIFMAAGPDGITVVRASDFALALPKRKELFDRLGCRSTSLESVKEKKLDDRYTLVETEWRMTFASGEQSRDHLLVGSAFILHRSEGRLKVVFYLAHQDIMVALRERGILPE